MNKIVFSFLFVSIFSANEILADEPEILSNSYSEAEARELLDVFVESEFSKEIQGKEVRIESCIEYKYSSCKYLLFYYENSCKKTLSAQEQCIGETCEYMVKFDYQYPSNCEIKKH